MVTTRTSIPPSVGEPVTDSTQPSTTEPATETKLRARLWVGRNPLPFVLACLFAGFWLGSSSVRSRRGEAS